MHIGQVPSGDLIGPTRTAPASQVQGLIILP